MHFVRIFSSCFFLFILISCAKRKESARFSPGEIARVEADSPVDLHPYADEMVKYDLSRAFKSQRPYNLPDILKCVRYVPLETGAECLVPEIRQCIMTDKYVYLDSGSEFDRVLIFDRDGRFVGSINSGRGPGEIVKLNNISYDEKAHELMILFSSSFISFYTETGAYKRTDKLPFSPDSFSVLDSSFVFYLNHTAANHHIPNLNNRRVLVTDRDYHIRYLNLPYNLSEKLHLGCSFPEISRNGEEIQLSFALTDTIYSYSSGAVKIRCCFDLGDEGIPRKRLQHFDDAEFFRFTARNDVFFYWGGYQESPGHRFVKYMKKGLGYQYFIDKRTGNITGGPVQESSSLPSVGMPVGVYGSSFIGLSDADDVVERINAIHAGAGYDHSLLVDSDLALLESVKPGDNPVLSIYELKEF